MLNNVWRWLGLLASFFAVQLGDDTGHVHTPEAGGKIPLNLSGRRMKYLSLIAMESRKQKFA